MERQPKKMRGGYKNQRIFCQSKTKFGVACKAKGYFVPSLKQFRCIWHGAIKSYTYEKRKYRNIFTKTNMSVENKIRKLRNLVNFRNKTDDEIKEYIREQEQRASTDKRYRSKFYRRRYAQWKNSIRIGKTTSDQIENFISIFRAKSKNTGTI